MTPRYRASFFDLDDTLFDHQTHRREALTAVAQTFEPLRGISLVQLESSHEAHLQRIHHAVLNGQLSVTQARMERMRGLLRDFGIEPDDIQVEACERTYRAAYDRQWRAVPGARQLLAALRGLGIWIGVITNGLWSEQTGKLRALGLESAVDDIIVSETVGSRKPARSFFEYALGRAAVEPTQCVVVGDLWEVDIQGALEMGLDSIWLNRYERRSVPTATVTEVTSLLPTSAVLRLFLKHPPPSCAPHDAVI
jgi:HAD superfamily hydrolase (TIGR01509 family)